MKRREEFGKRCELCRKNRESHMYPFPVDSKYRRLCRECWDKVHKSNAEAHGRRSRTVQPLVGSFDSQPKGE